MVDQADNIYEKVDSIMGKMEANPVAAMRVELLDSYFAKLENITGNVESCLTMFNTWKRRYRKDPNHDHKQEVKESIDEMQTASHAYREGIADKKKQLQPPPTAPVVGKNIKGEDEFKNIGQQELLKSEKAGVLDGGEFAKFDIQTLTPEPVCKDESSYLPQSAAVQPDLQADISSQTTKTKTLFTTENCRVTMRKPAGYFTSAELLLRLIHYLEIKLYFSRDKGGLGVTEDSGAKAPPDLTFPELTSVCLPREVLPVDLSRTKAALGTQASTEVMVKVDLEWMDSSDHNTSQVIFLQKKKEDVFWVRLVWDPGIAKPPYEAVLALIALD